MIHLYNLITHTWLTWHVCIQDTLRGVANDHVSQEGAQAPQTKKILKKRNQPPSPFHPDESYGLSVNDYSLETPSLAKSPSGVKTTQGASSRDVTFQSTGPDSTSSESEGEEGRSSRKRRGRLGEGSDSVGEALLSRSVTVSNPQTTTTATGTDNNTPDDENDQHNQVSNRPDRGEELVTVTVPLPDESSLSQADTLNSNHHKNTATAADPPIKSDFEVLSSINDKYGISMGEIIKRIDRRLDDSGSDQSREQLLGQAE